MTRRDLRIKYCLALVINDISCGREGENDSFTATGWTPEGRRARGRPKNYLQKDSRERAKQSWVEELVSTSQKVLVRQRGDLMGLLAR